jgi:ABC transport system ATP-binding/permease protein
MSTLHLRQVSMGFGLEPLLDKINLTLFPKDRLCIIGRNGAGKSTLLKIIAGTITPDEGEIQQQGQVITAMLPQEAPESSHETIYEMLSKSLGLPPTLLLKLKQKTLSESDYADFHRWDLLPKVETILAKLELNGETLFDALSGGFKRRVLLATALIHEPDILLMDEPTNHLDITGIEWLEKFMIEFNGAIVFITHDRSFLQNTATRIIELDRGKLIEFPGDYANYLRKKAELLEVEETHNKKFDKNLANEEVWIRQGIKARRTRNEGRVRALEALRRERQQRRENTGKVEFSTQKIAQSGKIVIETALLSYAYPDNPNKPIIRDFTTTILRGDKIGIIGENGVGKSTLIQLLLLQLTPDKGTVKHGSKLEIAYFDQHREQLNPEETVAQNITHGDQYVIYNNQSLHIISYLKQFLFSPERANTPVKALSGGEKNRLLLAKLFSKAANFIILDEPTNDLDFETLELLEDLLVNYTGTLLVVSHDRTFLNHVITTAFVFENEGKITEYIGGYDDIQQQRLSTMKKTEKVSTPLAAAPKPNYQQQKEIKTLETRIETLEKKIKNLEELLASAHYYDPSQSNELAKKQAEYQTLQENLTQAYALWEQLLQQ